MSFFVHGLFRNLLFSFLWITHEEKERRQGAPKVLTGAAGRMGVLPSKMGRRGQSRRGGRGSGLGLGGRHAPYTAMCRRQVGMQILSLGSSPGC